jgi:hypothetical protein
MRIFGRDYQGVRRFNSNTLKLEQCDVHVWLWDTLTAKILENKHVWFWDTLTAKIWENKHDVFINISKPPAEFSFCNELETAEKTAVL